MKKAVLLPEQDCFLRILQILLIGVIALDGVEHVALEVGAHQLLCRLEVVVQNEPEDFVMLLVDLFAAGGLIVDVREQLEPGAELGVRFVETGALRIGVEDLVELLGVILPFRDLPAGERPVAGFDVLAQRLPQGVLHLEDGILTADGTTFVACSCSDRVLLGRSYEE